MASRGLFKRFRRARSEPGSDQGFTLIELLVVTTILPLIIGALSAGLIAVFSLQGSVTNRLANSSDSQVVASNYVQDVQASQMITTQSAPSCGTASQVQMLGLEWDSVAGTFQSVVSYVIVPEGTQYSLVRQFCNAGASTTPSATATVAYNMPKWVVGNASLLTILPSASASAAAGGWTSAQPVTGVTFTINEPGSATRGSAPYAYTLVAVPAAGAPLGQQGSPVATTTGCDFALPGTGTYAKSLCFINFNPFNSSNLSSPANLLTATWPGAMQVTVAIPGGYVMSFSISIQNEATAPIFGTPFPTYGVSFMGNANNGVPFYSGVGCPAGTPTITGGAGTTSCTDPSLYQCVGNSPSCSGKTNTITISNISVIDPAGNPATGWQFVTGDAETTDPNENITWTSNQPFTLIPNNQVAGQMNEGNACNASTTPPNGNTAVPNSGGQNLVFSNGNETVTCTSTWQDSGTPRTGAVMLESAQPTTVTAEFKGAGLEGVFFGLLLPS